MEIDLQESFVGRTATTLFIGRLPEGEQSWRKQEGGESRLHNRAAQGVDT